MSINLRNIYLLVLVVAAIALSLAYIAEYITAAIPCPLCVYERFPYLIFIMIGIIGLAGSRSSLLLSCLIIISFGSILLSSYHIGIERGYFELSELCRPLVTVSDNLSVSDFVKLLYNKSYIPTCDKPELMIFGLSMATLNLILNFVLFMVFVYYRYFFYNPEP